MSYLLTPRNSPDCYYKVIAIKLICRCKMFCKMRESSFAVFLDGGWCSDANSVSWVSFYQVFSSFTLHTNCFLSSDQQIVNINTSVGDRYLILQGEPEKVSSLLPIIFIHLDKMRFFSLYLYKYISIYKLLQNGIMPRF